MLARIGKLLVVGFLLAAPVAALQEAEDTRPLSEAAFIRLVNAKTPAERLIEIVRARGVSFTPSAELEDGLKKLGLNEVLAALTEPATLELHVNVPGTEVVVDGKAREATPPQGPLALSGLAPGDHNLRLRAEGYVEDSLGVFLKPGETHKLEVALRPAVTLAPGPLGTRVSVKAGTSADAALAQLEFASTPEARVEMLTKLVKDFAESPLALEGYSQLQGTYLEMERYADSLAAGAEVLRRDPGNFRALLRQAYAYLGQGEAEAAFTSAAEARRLVEALTAATPPAGADVAAWQRERSDLLEGAQNDLKSLTYSAFVAVSQVPDSARRRALTEKFLEVFPQSDYRAAALMTLAVASQQLGDAEAMLRWAGQGLEANPDQGLLLVLVSDALSEQGKELARARRLATHLLQLLKSDPDKARPAGFADEQWAQISQLWEGTAHSVLGQVLMYEETAQVIAAMAKTREAVEEFKVAAPLLKADTQSYARNLYRLGYAYAKLGERPRAREALREVMSLETPYRQVAAPLLEKLK